MSEKFKNLFYEKLDLVDMSFKEQSAFLISMTNYLKNNKDEKFDFVSEKLNKLLEFLNVLDFSNTNVVQILTIYPNIIDIVDDLYEKYLFLGVIENLDNTIRRTKILNKPKDFVIGLAKLYARYLLINESGYDNISWNILVHATDRSFAKEFVRSRSNKSYQMFEDELGVLDYLASVDMDKFNIEEYKKLPVNEEIVRRYEEER